MTPKKRQIFVLSFIYGLLSLSCFGQYMNHSDAFYGNVVGGILMFPLFYMLTIDMGKKK